MVAAAKLCGCEHDGTARLVEGAGARPAQSHERVVAAKLLSRPDDTHPKALLGGGGDSWGSPLVVAQAVAAKAQVGVVDPSQGPPEALAFPRSLREDHTRLAVCVL